MEVGRRKIKVRCLDINLTNAEIKNHFKQYGNVISVMTLIYFNNTSIKHGSVMFETESGATRALNEGN